MLDLTDEIRLLLRLILRYQEDTMYFLLAERHNSIKMTQRKKVSVRIEAVQKKHFNAVAQNVEESKKLKPLLSVSGFQKHLKPNQASLALKIEFHSKSRLLS